MKKLISAALGLLICMGAYAQYEKVDELLRHFRQGDRISLDFGISHSGESHSIAEGRLELQGKLYSVKAGDMTIICDGKTQWTIDEAGQEIYLEQGGQLSSLLSNTGYIKKSLSALNSSDNSICGVFAAGKDGSTKLDFKLENITYGKASEDLSEFSLDCSEYQDPWVVTDLR